MLLWALSTLFGMRARRGRFLVAGERTTLAARIAPATPSERRFLVVAHGFWAVMCVLPVLFALMAAFSGSADVPLVFLQALWAGFGLRHTAAIREIRSVRSLVLDTFWRKFVRSKAGSLLVFLEVCLCAMWTMACVHHGPSRWFGVPALSGGAAGPVLARWSRSLVVALFWLDVVWAFLSFLRGAFAACGAEMGAEEEGASVHSGVYLVGGDDDVEHSGGDGGSPPHGLPLAVAQVILADENGGVDLFGARDRGGGASSSSSSSGRRRLRRSPAVLLELASGIPGDVCCFCLDEEEEDACAEDGEAESGEGSRDGDKEERSRRRSSRWVVMPWCGHRFHAACGGAWVSRSGWCPICRTPSSGSAPRRAPPPPPSPPLAPTAAPAGPGGSGGEPSGGADD